MDDVTARTTKMEVVTAKLEAKLAEVDEMQREIERQGKHLAGLQGEFDAECATNANFRKDTVGGSA